jgi:Zn-dependent protease
VLHELCHGLTALALGDTTAKDAGRLTLNPLKHLDIFGLAMMAVFKVGYAKPVPVDMRRFKNPRLGMALTAFAGPLSNVVLAALVLFVTGFLVVPLANAGSTGYYIYMLLDRTAYLSCIIAVFNIIPIPPLDGSKVLFGLILPDRWYYKLMQYERFGFIIVIAFVYLNVSTLVLSTASAWLYDKLSFFLYLSFSAHG